MSIYMYIYASGTSHAPTRTAKTREGPQWRVSKDRRERSPPNRQKLMLWRDEMCEAAGGWWIGEDSKNQEFQNANFGNAPNSEIQNSLVLDEGFPRDSNDPPIDTFYTFRRKQHMICRCMHALRTDTHVMHALISTSIACRSCLFDRPAARLAEQMH